MTDLNKNEFKMGVSNRTNRLGAGIGIITKSQLGQHKIDGRSKTIISICHLENISQA